MDEGWIKIHRRLKKHWIWKDAEKLKAWVTILMEVNHDGKTALIQGELIECERGQSVKSIGTWAKELRWTPKKFRTFLKLLENDSMIVREGLHKTTRLTVCNYDTYQAIGQAKGTQRAHRGHTEGTQRATNKNEKNDKNEKNYIDENSKKNLKEMCPDPIYDQVTAFIKEHPEGWQIRKQRSRINKYPQKWIQDNIIEFSGWWQDKNPNSDISTTMERLLGWMVRERKKAE